jgi:hypothetical protein
LLGRYRSADALSAFLDEDYSQEYDGIPVFPFYGSQGETFCDHDSMEAGFRGAEPTLKEFLMPYSYSEHWADELASRDASKGLGDANSLVFISKAEIAAPRTVTDERFTLTCLGEIGCPI